MSKLQRYRLVDDVPTSMFARMLTKIRSYNLGPLTSNSPELAKWWGRGQASSAGVNVSEWTALNYAAVWSAVNLIASDVASLPLVLYKRLPDGGKERFPSHPLYKLLHDRPNPEMTSVVFRKALHAHVLMWGNGYAEIERDQADRPKALWLLTPDRVTPFRLTPDSPLQYRVSNPGRPDAVLDQREILHIPGLGWDGTCGYSVIAKARESIGLGMAAEQFGGTFFGNGASMGGTVSYAGPKPPELSNENYKEALKAEHQGASKAHKLLMLYNGAKYERIGIPPNDAQFLETRLFQITEIARWFNVPPFKIGDLTRATFSNIEQQAIDYYTTTLVPWLTVWEQELGFKLIASLEQGIQFVEHIADGVLRGDTAARSASYGAQFLVGGVTPNEVRASENRNNIPGGDRAFVPMNMWPLDRIDEIVDAEIAAKRAPKVAPAPPAPEPPKRDAELEQELALARRKAQDAEDARDVATALFDEQAGQFSVAQAEARDLTAAVEVLTATNATLLATVADVTRDKEAETARAAMIEVDYRRACDEKQAAADGLQAQIALVEAVKADRETARAAHASEVQALRESSALDIVSAQEETARANDRVSDTEQRIATMEAVTAELRAQIAAFTTEAETRQATLIEAREALARTTAQYEAAVEARAQSETTVTAQAADLTAAQAWLATASASVRSVVVDGLTWLIEREADRARRAQGSPEKLQKWIETYYPGHDELCRKILRPSVRAWAACTGQTEPVDEVLDRFVAQHVNQSIRQLRLLAEEHTAETLAPALEKTLRRWEADRAETDADQILRDAMGDSLVPQKADGAPVSHAPEPPKRVRKIIKRDAQNRITEVIEDTE